MASDAKLILAPFRGFLKLFNRKNDSAYYRQAESALMSLCEEGLAAGKGFDPIFVGQILDNMRLAHQERRSQRDKYCADDLRRIARRARELREYVRKLRRSSFVVAANLAGEVPIGDLLHFDWSSPETIAGAELPTFDTLISLPALAKWYRLKTLHGTDGYLSDLCRYIKARTGGPHDALVVKILQPLNIPHTETEGALREWRHRLTKRVTPKRQKRAS